MAEGALIQMGIAGLDDILWGGLPEGNVVLVKGAAGTGKTLLGMEFIYHGVTVYNEPGLIVSFEVSPQKLLRDAASFGWDCAALQQQNWLKLLFTSPQVLSQELQSPDSLLLETAAEMGAQRLCIDGMTSYMNALQDEQQYHQFFHALVSYTKERLMTTFLSYENPELFGINQFMPEFPVSSIVDNIVLLNFVELGNTLHRAITVAKARGSANRFVTREFTIGPGGITLAPEDAATALPILPFQSYYGLLSRAPTRLSAALPYGLPPQDVLQVP
jgi:circadian clock protein KaiC